MEAGYWILRGTGLRVTVACTYEVIAAHGKTLRERGCEVRHGESTEWRADLENGTHAGVGGVGGCGLQLCSRAVVRCSSQMEVNREMANKRPQSGIFPSAEDGERAWR